MVFTALVIALWCAAPALAIRKERKAHIVQDVTAGSADPRGPADDGFADSCPAGRGIVKSQSSTAVPDVFTLLEWNVEWAYAPDGKRVRWLNEVVAPARKAGSNEYDGVLECPKDFDSASCSVDPYPLDKADPGGRAGPGGTCAKMWHHIHKLSEEMADMPERPDVVVLPEVDGCTVLRHMEADLKSHDPDYESYLVYGPNRRTNSQTGFISRLTPRTPLWMSSAEAPTPSTNNEHCAVPQGAYGAEKHFVAELELEGGLQVFVIGVHLKSMRQDSEGEACSIREAEAKVLNKLLDDIYAKEPNAEIIVTGDFNDFDPEVPDRRGAASAKIGGEFPLGNWTDCFRGNCKQRSDEGNLGQRSRVFEMIKGSGPRPRLTNLMGNVDREKLYSHAGARHSAFGSICNRRKGRDGQTFWSLGKGYEIPPNLSPADCPGDSLLDHVLVTPGLAAAAFKVEVLNDYSSVYMQKAVQKWARAGRGGRYGTWDARKLDEIRPSHESDHYPVLVQFNLSALRYFKATNTYEGLDLEGSRRS